MNVVDNMKTRINDVSFDHDNPEFVEFYNQHGWVVLKNVLDENTLKNTLDEWRNMKTRFAKEMEMPLEEYELEVSQWRDLWMQDNIFHDLIFDDHITPLITKGMSWNGVRLLHDHIIAKPHKGSNKKIPWHQDSMFWPVDLPGCSSWIALKDVAVNDGCLEVIDSSHLEGCDEPVDFMAKEREDFPEDSIRMKLPISAGSMILLHSLTWHRSSPNQGLTNRPAYLGLWIHPDAKWRPDLVDWHPLNEFVEGKEGERLVGKKFPAFGKIDIVSPPEIDIHSGTIRYNDISMFDASKIIGKQLAIISKSTGGIVEVLSNPENIKKIVHETKKHGICEDEKEVEKALKRLWVSYSAYHLHRARNVYNDAYAFWWELAGKKWNENLNEVVL